ncbi:MAG: hypothetical protein CM15mP32_3440 [Flavobacteriaceae bacterium]|nr:MAG: hypothetical protein CM15mP32_3440 [Flavobacteriaceae bacterium]
MHFYTIHFFLNWHDPICTCNCCGYPGDYQPPLMIKPWFNPNNIVARYNTILSFIGQDYNDNFGNGSIK